MRMLPTSCRGWILSFLRPLLVTTIILLAMVGALRLAKPGYRRFVEDKDQRYYFKFARACDALLAQHPLGTNEFIEIRGTDGSVPPIIHALHPSRITLSSNRVHILVGDGRGGFGISWEAEETNANSWAIAAWGQSTPTVVYVETR